MSGTLVKSSNNKSQIFYYLSFRQNSDTESCDMLNNRRKLPLKHALVMRTDSGDISADTRDDYAEDGDNGIVGATAGFSGPKEQRRHLQSVDSNHMESQSEWSDDELGRDGELEEN